MKVKLITRKYCFGISGTLNTAYIRTGPASAVAVSVYPGEETTKNATVARNARIENCT